MWTSQKDSGSQFSPTQPSPSFPVFPCSRVMTLNGPGLVLHPSLLGSAFSHMIRSRPMGKTQNSVGPLFLMEIDYWLGTTTEMFEGRQTEGEKEQEACHTAGTYWLDRNWKRERPQFTYIPNGTGRLLALLPSSLSSFCPFFSFLSFFLKILLLIFLSNFSPFSFCLSLLSSFSSP